MTSTLSSPPDGAPDSSGREPSPAMSTNAQLPRRTLSTSQRWAVATACLLLLVVGVAMSRPQAPTTYDALIVRGASATSPVSDEVDDVYARSEAVSKALHELTARGYEVSDILALDGDRILLIVRR